MRISFLAGVILLFSTVTKAQSEWVNPFIGTGGHGHTYPGATAPFGMVQLSPDTRLDGWDGCGGYHYSDSAIYGFSHTHLSGTGVSDYGDILLMPMLSLNWTSEEVKTGFSHADEKAFAGYYEVTMANEIKAELTASTRVGVHRYTFPKGSRPYLLIDLLHRDRVLDASIEVVDEKNLNGNRRSSAWAVDQNVFYHIRLSQKFKDIIDDPENPEHRKALKFKKLKKPLTIWVGLSSTSAEAALANLEAEVSEKDFFMVKEETRNAWNQELSKIQIEASDQQKTIFYTALYHTMIVPNIFSDISGKYRGMDGEVHQAEGDHYTVFSLWDTYRTTHPLYTLIDHKRTQDFIYTFERMFDQTGRLPIWELAGNETECMIGYHGASVLADAAVKGLSPLSPERALELAGRSSEYPLFGMAEYREKGYLDIEDEHESVSKTLEYGYDDFCVAQIARQADQPMIYEMYDLFSLAYRNVMDEKGFMHPRTNGKRLEDFDPRQVNNHFTEANSWQYSFYVPHDLQGFMKRLGGPKALEEQLDQLFSADNRTTGRTQADITGLIGQYAHGNEPSHHISYLYNTAGVPHKTQEKVKQILETLYHNAPDGLSGNEDCGQMSAWYVMSSLGFYPVCPGDPRYVIGYPAVDKAEIKMGNGQTMTIQKFGEGQYIDHVVLNGVDYQYNFLRHKNLVEGGTLEFHMSESPSNWGTGMDKVFLTAVRTDYLTSPVLNYSAPVFFDSLKIEWANPDNLDVKLFWMGKNDPYPYNKELVGHNKDYFMATESGRLTVQFENDKLLSPPAYVEVHKRTNKYVAKWINEPNPQYQAGGPDALVDEVQGDGEWRKGRWIGIQGEPFVMEVDLLETTTINALGLSCLQDVKAWICFPRSVVFKGRNSAEGEWKTINTVAIGDRSLEEGSFTEPFEVPVNDNFRYIRVEAEQFGPLPDWHPGAGHASYIFVDELKIFR